MNVIAMKSAQFRLSTIVVILGILLLCIISIVGNGGFDIFAPGGKASQRLAKLQL